MGTIHTAGSHESYNGTGLRALAAAPLPNLTSLGLVGACLSAEDVSGALSSAPWLATLTRLDLCYNDLGTSGHRAVSLLHLPRVRALALSNNGLSSMGLARLAAAPPWLTQLTQLTPTEQFAPEESYEDILEALDGDAWAFGCLRRLGCVIRLCLSS